MFYRGLKAAPCRVCGMPVVFIKLPNGKKMPCDAQAERYVHDENGRTFYGPDGHAEKGTPCSDPRERLMIGYRPHWSSCPAGSSRYKMWSAKAAAGQGKKESAAAAEPAAPASDAKPEPEYEQLALFEYY